MELERNPTSRTQPSGEQDFHLRVPDSSAQADTSEIQPILPLRNHRDSDHHRRTLRRV